MTGHAAQNQHYVPKFILRKFLANKDKERVNVFQKSTGRRFQTNIANVMAERRFHEFNIDERYYASFEESACRVEDAVLPAYEALVNRQRLDGSPEERMMLGVFVAFQLLRTRAYRDQMNTLFKGVQNHLKKLGLPEHELAVMDDLSDKRLAQSHLESLRSSIEKFSSIIATKDFLLLQAPNDKAFYLSDNPVALHNDEGKEGFFGNIGLSVKGIQLYIPLSSRFMLAALCPSILASFRTTFEENKKSAQQVKAMLALSPTAYGSKRIELEAHLSLLKDSLDKVESFIRAANEGTPLIATGETMEFYNSLQVASAREFVVCEKGDFRLAKRFVDREGPGGGGLKLKMG